MKNVGIDGAIVGCASITVAYLALQSFPRPLYVLSNTSETAFSVIPMLLGFYALKAKVPFIRSMRWLTFGFLFWFLGEVTYSIYALLFGIAIPYPSIADLFWLIGYPLVLVGMAVFLHQFRYAIRRITVIIVLGISAVAVGLIFLLLIMPTISISPILAVNIVGFAYPILDVALLFASLIGVLLFWGGKVGRGWYWIALASILFSLADIGFSYLTARGLYYDGHPLDLFYDYAYVCYGFSVYSQIKGLE
jgi:hypothetical protein